MAAKGVTLAANASLSGTQSTPMFFSGGKSVLAVQATGYGTTVQLQMLGPNGTGWLNLGTSFAADSAQSFDLPAGQYRMNSVGSTTGLYASLVAVPYT